MLLHPSEMSRGRRWLATLLRSRELSILLVLLAVIAVATIKTPSFLFSGNSWRDLLLTPSILILLAVGQAVVIITRNVDLSVGSVLGLTAYLTGRLFIDHPGLPLIAVILIGVLAGALLGLVNGLLVGFGRVPALVITLGTLYIYRGIVLTWAGSDRINASDLPRDFLALGTKQVLTLPVLFLMALAVLVAVGYHLHTARSGRELYAILNILPTRWSPPTSSIASPRRSSTPAPASSCRPSPPSSSAGSRSSGAAAPCGGPPSARCSW